MSELATVARPYAKALIMFARENDSLESYQEMLENFLTLISEESVVKMLKDDSLDKAKKASILKEVVGSFADKNFQNFVPSQGLPILGIHFFLIIFYFLSIDFLDF